MMSYLKSLTFTTFTPNIRDPKILRRERLIERIEEQQQLLKDPNFKRVIKRWKKTEDGSRSAVETRRPVAPWWRMDANGKLILTVKAGLKPLEFEKGKAGIAVGSEDKLESVLATVLAATRAGELDGPLGAPKLPLKRQ